MRETIWRGRRKQESPCTARIATRCRRKQERLAERKRDCLLLCAECKRDCLLLCAEYSKRDSQKAKHSKRDSQKVKGNTRARYIWNLTLLALHRSTASYFTLLAFRRTLLALHFTCTTFCMHFITVLRRAVSHCIVFSPASNMRAKCIAFSPARIPCYYVHCYRCLTARTRRISLYYQVFDSEQK